ncbi:bacillithiol biosynthesis deacetylase BshB1 [Evansella tamaricis]|uniref:Bacillithiol biosynthesis deacetylase BshB1 n=1 Tax=Evansella tamaricis TaxID=2069301 RepID=A0ABS6JLS6_9BACI|nr:bacillithiol biosynthesis deacetylase BshB1 [Evansella tamaricis]MBU9714619.1 bacillithiol biosynthesis deacetylase BshB1 [Evansella tamaricis]
MDKLDILAVGAHPDDVEIGMGGTLAKYAFYGYKTGIVNLTKAELSSNGTVEERQNEAVDAANVLGVSKRIQLNFPDRHLLDNRSACIQELVTIIRKYRPRIVFAPDKEDRHPDHGHCTELVKEAIFSAGIKNYFPESNPEAFRPDSLLYFQINGVMKPQIVIDITDYIDKKMEALACFKSQFQLGDNQVKTPLNTGYLDQLKGRERLMGNEVGVEFGEAFRSDKPVLIQKVLGE